MYIMLLGGDRVLQRISVAKPSPTITQVKATPLSVESMFSDSMSGPPIEQEVYNEHTIIDFNGARQKVWITEEVFNKGVVRFLLSELEKRITND